MKTKNNSSLYFSAKDTLRLVWYRNLTIFYCQSCGRTWSTRLTTTSPAAGWRSAWTGFSPSSAAAPPTRGTPPRRWSESSTKKDFRNSKNKIFQDTLNIEKEFDILFLILSVPTLGSELKDNFSSLSVAGLRSQDCK